MQPDHVRLVMVPMDPHIEFCFGHLTAALGGRHWVVSKIPGSHYYGTYGKISVEEMKILGDTVEVAYNYDSSDIVYNHEEL
jgi:hypothetical protein